MSSARAATAPVCRTDRRKARDGHCQHGSFSKIKEVTGGRADQSLSAEGHAYRGSPIDRTIAMKVFPTIAARRAVAVAAAVVAGLAISTAAYAATSSPGAVASVPRCAASDLGVWVAVDQGNGAA